MKDLSFPDAGGIRSQASYTKVRLYQLSKLIPTRSAALLIQEMVAKFPVVCQMQNTTDSLFVMKSICIKDL